MNQLTLYFSAITPKIAKMYKETFKKKLDVLISFYSDIGHVIDTVNAFSNSVNSIILDSGAFSTFNRPIEEREETKYRFYAFLKYTLPMLADKIPFSQIMAFDAYADETMFEENFKLYSSMNSFFKLTPVIHSINNHAKEIDRYSELKPDFISIGKLSQEKKFPVIKPIIDKIHAVGCKCHLLGVTNYKTLSVSDIETCDSKSWLDDAKTGVIQYPVINGDKLEPKRFKIPRKEEVSDEKIPYLNKFQYKKDFYNEMSNFGLSRAKFSSTQNTNSLILANLYYTQKIVEFINQQRAKAHQMSKNEPNPVSGENSSKTGGSSKQSGS